MPPQPRSSYSCATIESRASSSRKRLKRSNDASKDQAPPKSPPEEAIRSIDRYELDAAPWVYTHGVVLRGEQRPLCRAPRGGAHVQLHICTYNCIWEPAKRTACRCRRPRALPHNLVSPRMRSPSTGPTTSPGSIASSARVGVHGSAPTNSLLPHPSPHRVATPLCRRYQPHEFRDHESVSLGDERHRLVTRTADPGRKRERPGWPPATARRRGDSGSSETLGSRTKTAQKS